MRAGRGGALRAHREQAGRRRSSSAQSSEPVRGSRPAARRAPNGPAHRGQAMHYDVDVVTSQASSSAVDCDLGGHNATQPQDGVRALADIARVSSVGDRSAASADDSVEGHSGALLAAGYDSASEIFILGQVPSLLTLWRYVGIAGLAEDDVARASLNEMNRTYLAKQMQRAPLAPDINLRANAMGFMSGQSALRHLFIKIVDTQAFDMIILITIALNTIVMAMQRDDLEFLDWTFLGLFTIEMILKVGARGFAMHRGAYLRFGWNILDFIIVIAGYVTIALEASGADGTNLTPLRLLRVIRPLRAVSRVRGLKVIMETVVHAAGTLKDVLFLSAFFLVVFAVVGIQLWNGEQHFHCFADIPEALHGMPPVQADTTCCDELAGGRSLNSSLTRQHCVRDTGQFGDIGGVLPSNGSYYLCSADSIATAYRSVQNQTASLRHYLLRNVSVGCSRNLPDGVGTQCDAVSTGITGLEVRCHKDNSQFSKDILNFDNIGSAIMLCFKIMSLDDWPVDMKEIQDVSGQSAALFFIILTLLGNYFTVNLVLAVLSTVFSEERTHAEGDRHAFDTRPVTHLTPATAVAGAMLLPPLIVVNAELTDPRPKEVPDEDEFHLDEDDEEDAREVSAIAAAEAQVRERRRSTGAFSAAPSSVDMLENQRKSSQVSRRRSSAAAESQKTARVRNKLTPIVTHKSFDWFMTVATLVNICAMAIDHYGIDAALQTILEFINLVCSGIFLVEMCMKLYGLGMRGYFAVPFNCFDCTLVVVSLVEFGMQLAKGEIAGGSSFSALRAFRAFRLAGAVPTLRALLITIVRSVKSVFYVGVLMLITVFIYALFGITLFTTDENDGIFEGARPNFANVAQAMLTVFVVFTGEGWATIMVAVMGPARLSRWSVGVYFVSCFVVGNYLLSNLFVAILIDSFSRSVSAGDYEGGDAVVVQVQKADTLAASIGVRLDGCSVVHVERGKPAHLAKVRKHHLVTGINGAAVDTGDEAEEAFRRSGEDLCVDVTPQAPALEVRHARSTAGESRMGMNGAYKRTGERHGKPLYSRSYRHLCCNKIRRKVPITLSYDADPGHWAVRGPDFEAISSDPPDSAPGADPEVPSTGWPGMMRVRPVGEPDPGVPFHELRPIGKQLVVFDNVITAWSATPFLMIDYRPESTVGNLKARLQRKMLPLRNVAPGDQNLHFGPRGVNSEPLPDEARMISVLNSGCGSDSGDEEEEGGQHAKLRLALPGEQELFVENCIILDYRVQGCIHVELSCFGRIVPMAIGEPLADGPEGLVEQESDLMRAIARRLKIADVVRLRVTDMSGRIVRLNRETAEEAAEACGGGGGALPVGSEVMPRFRVHVLPIPVLVGQRVTYNSAGMYGRVEGVVVGEGMHCCPRGCRLRKQLVLDVMKRREEITETAERVTCSVSGRTLAITEQVWCSTGETPGYRYDVADDVYKLFVRVQVEGGEEGRERAESIALHYWDGAALPEYEHGVEISFDAHGRAQYQILPGVPPGVFLRNEEQLPPHWRSPVLEHPSAALPLQTSTTLFPSSPKGGERSQTDFFRPNSRPDAAFGTGGALAPIQQPAATLEMEREMATKTERRPLGIYWYTLLPKKREQSTFRKALFQTETKRKMQESAEKRTLWAGMEGNALGFLPADSKVRQFLGNVESHPAFDHIVAFVIALNTLFIANDAPSVEKEKPTLASILQIGDYIFTSFFCFEALIRSLVHGFYDGEGAYLQSKWNRFDFCVALLSVAGLIHEVFKPARALRVVRLLLRLPGMGPQQRMALSALLKSVTMLSNVLIISGLFGCVFGILGVAIFKGAFGACNDASIDRMAECTGNYNASRAGAFGPEYAVRPREWQWEEFGFNHLADGLRTLLWVAIGETWASIMYRAIDSQGEDMGPAVNGTPFAAVYFVIFVFVGQFFMLNLFVGVLIDGFQTEKDAMAGKSLLTEQQLEFLTYEKLINRAGLTARAKEPAGCYGARELCYLIVSTKNSAGEAYFDYAVTFFILMNTLALMTLHAEQAEFWTTLQDTADWIFIAIFTFEMVVKVMASSMARYAADPWNRFDSVVVLVSWMGKLLQNTFLKTLRIARFIRLINISKGLQVVFLTLIHSLEQLFNVAVLLVVVIFMFAVFGVQLCGSVRHTDKMNDYSNFDDVGQAILTLYTIATTEGWLDVMDGCKLKEPDCSEEKGDCGFSPYLVETYFTLFMVVVAIITINLFITVLLENFNEIGKEEELQQKIAPLLGGHSGSLREMWLDADPTATHYISANKFFSIIKRLGFPYWSRALIRGRGDLTAIVQLRRLPIPVVGERQVRWTDCVLALAMVLAGVSNADGFSCSREVRGSEEYRARRWNILSLHHWYAANVIQKHWKQFKRLQLAHMVWRELNALHRAVQEQAGEHEGSLRRAKSRRAMSVSRIRRKSLTAESWRRSGSSFPVRYGTSATGAADSAAPSGMRSSEPLEG
eukprot:TRINITY_DN10322_c0_g1_i1.p1 TRINITY_DN10322_c0_g1~~TRINITY_DN10322_c0_g1_i1.p1  ORF type:complete len:2489 (+),score=759.50 TRINITY_DN10322_c0_g1_i1:117-7469(+)